MGEARTCANCAHRAMRHHPAEPRSQKPRMPWVCLLCCRAVGPESCDWKSLWNGNRILDAPCGSRREGATKVPRDWEPMPDGTLWKLWRAYGGEPELIIRAKTLDDALAMARLIDPAFGTAQPLADGEVVR